MRLGWIRIASLSLSLSYTPGIIADFSDVKTTLRSKGSPSKNMTTDFIFGVATAPAHVEDGLNDVWLDFAKSGGVAGFDKTPYAAERTRYWVSKVRTANVYTWGGRKTER